jgi:hypothetical protein
MITFCIIGNDDNLETHKTSFLVIFAGKASYNFNTTLLFIWPSGTWFPN